MTATTHAAVTAKVISHAGGETARAVEQRLREAIAPESAVDVDEHVGRILAAVMRARQAAIHGIVEAGDARATTARKFLEAHGH